MHLQSVIIFILHFPVLHFQSTQPAAEIITVLLLQKWQQYQMPVTCHCENITGSDNYLNTNSSKQESRAVARKPRDATAVLFGLQFADNIHHKFKSSQASKTRLQSSKHTGAKQNLTQNGHSRWFKVTCFGVSGKVIKD